MSSDPPIGPTTTVTELYDTLNSVSQRLIANAVERALAGDPGTEQDEAAASYSCTRVPDDGEIDWSASTAAAFRLVRALAPPFPGAFTWVGLKRLWILDAAPAPDPPDWVGRLRATMTGSPG
ncbi:MAG TPA: hypothetical protein VFF40_02305 [Acidimicrobiia bacterium]|nr:hypothetical protein [Acidimicrobiia bacterium]